MFANKGLHYSVVDELFSMHMHVGSAIWGGRRMWTLSTRSARVDTGVDRPKQSMAASRLKGCEGSSFRVKGKPQRVNIVTDVHKKNQAQKRHSPASSPRLFEQV